MDQFSHDLTLALEETSLLDKARRWAHRRRTRSAGNLPCAPQPTEDSSSPNDTIQTSQFSSNVDGLNANIAIVSDSDEKDVRFPRKLGSDVFQLGTLESDSVNETFSPARKRKLKRMSVEFEIDNTNSEKLESDLLSASTTGTIRKRIHKPDSSNRSNIFFCGKRKRSNRDRNYDHDNYKSQSTSMPRYIFFDEAQMRPRSFSSTSTPQSERLLPLNKGLISRIEKLSNHKTERINSEKEPSEHNFQENLIANKVKSTERFETGTTFTEHRKNRRRATQTHLQFAVDHHPMDYGESNSCSSSNSSSLSSTGSDDDDTANGTDREGDDELTDWPGNETAIDNKYDPKRKLTKKNQQHIKFEDGTIIEDDNVMSRSCEWSNINKKEHLEVRFQPSEPIAILNNSCAIFPTSNYFKDDINITFKQIESDISGETTNRLLASSCNQTSEVREIRAGCRRIKCERPGFSIKTSANERLARFLQDPTQTQIRLPDIEIYEHESLINLSTLYSLHMSIENGCAVLSKTSKTTQSVNMDHKHLQNGLFLRDFKRRCFENGDSLTPP
ncbi:uncharacterized protein LOC119676466 isoform X2 [Teleopsis dalmanni]|uniref:uncharacterized protein LOC119676466 isoform X2 n=1 Tax=Teleopsis dalmanni TaxID=139649 RepID=UPI0018CE2CCD|nr:uncharacterized protein LOC119676466 isoform X2 [Teleopsis dalmanni]